MTMLRCPSCFKVASMNVLDRVGITVCPNCGARLDIMIEAKVSKTSAVVECKTRRCVTCEKLYCPVCDCPPRMTPRCFVHPDVCPVCVETPRAQEK